MPINTVELINAVSLLCDEREMKVTVKQSAKGEKSHILLLLRILKCSTISLKGLFLPEFLLSSEEF